MTRTAPFYESRSDRYLTAERMVSGFSFTTLGAQIRSGYGEDWTDAVLTQIDAEDACAVITKQQIANAVAKAKLQKEESRRRTKKITADTSEYWLQIAKPGTPAHRQYQIEREQRRKEIASRRTEMDDLELQNRKRWFNP